MIEIFDRHFDTIKWSPEFVMLPLHWLAVAHFYALGLVVLMTYVAASIQHARVNGLGHKAKICRYRQHLN